MKYLSFLIAFIACLSTFFLLPDTALSGESYMFERMWPTLPQPWYFDNPRGIAADQNGDVYIVDSFNNRIQKFTQDGEFITKWGGEGSSEGKFDHPNGIAIDNNNNVYVADSGNRRIQEFTSDGTFIMI
jgi:tripartite motif-containing protein 71